MKYDDVNQTKAAVRELTTIDSMIRDSTMRKHQFNSHTKMISSMKKDIVSKSVVRPAVNESSVKRLIIDHSSPQLRAKINCMGSMTVITRQQHG